MAQKKINEPVKKLSKRMLTEKDICHVIATYNRADDLKRTLDTIAKCKNPPAKIIIVDQSEDDKTKNLVKTYKKSKLRIEYVHSDIPSSSISLNMGNEVAKKDFALIINSGDDIDFPENYFKEMASEFNSNPKAIGVAGTEKPLYLVKFDFKTRMKNLILRLFFLPYCANHKILVTGPYGIVNTSKVIVKRKIDDAQWLSGMNVCYKKEVYKDYMYPPIKGYDLLEDIDESHMVYKKYGVGSLVMNPKCEVNHRYSLEQRYPQKKRIFSNHEDHFSFYYRHFNNFSGTLKMIWSLFGIVAGGFAGFIFSPSEITLLRAEYNLQAILYCIKNRENIKKGIYRKFWNEKFLSQKSPKAQVPKSY